MPPVFEFTPGELPLLISMPHSGTDVPSAIIKTFTGKATALPDTDWYIPTLYSFTHRMGCPVLKANYSRYVIDLNRPPDDESLYPGQATTGLCPLTLFDGSPIYQAGENPDDGEISRRLERYWAPYHHKLKLELERIRERFGYALLYDAHSIPGQVPRLFQGELPELNLGTASASSCSPRLQAIAEAAISSREYTSVSNGRFRGGYITRHYGNPGENIHALQMEISQRCYINEPGTNEPGTNEPGTNETSMQESVDRSVDTQRVTALVSGVLEPLLLKLLEEASRHAG